MKLLCPLLLIGAMLSNQTQAQTTWYTDASAMINRAYLQNKTDRQSGQVTNNHKLTQGFGLRFGFSNGKNTFQGLSLGVMYNTYKQGTTTSQTVGGDYTSATSLSYLTIPLEGKFGIGHFGKIRPFISVGVYGSLLLHYKERSTQPQGLPVTDITVEQKQVSYSGASGIHGEYQYSKGIYNNLGVGALAAAGAAYDISPRLALQLRIGASYSFTDIERKGEIKYEGSLYTIPVTRTNYWDYNTPKGLPGGQQERSATHLLVPALELGITYHFNKAAD